MPTLNTVDISAYTKSIDMAKVAQQCDTIIIKATEGAGDGENNPFFSGPGRNDWQAARDAGLVRGAYHLFYSRPGSSTPDQQAAHFLNRLAHIRDGDLPPAIDLEPDLSFKGMADRTAAIAAVLRWLQLVESGLKARTGKALKPFIYANPSVINDELHNPPAFADYPLFLAHYAPTPAAPRPWSNDDILIWQYRENTSIPATVDDCDFCQFSTFQRGSRGRPVRAIQNRLIASGLLPAGSADGAFDSATHEAVKKFQDGHGLAVDGVVSPRTWVAMQWA